MFKNTLRASIVNISPVSRPLLSISPLAAGLTPPNAATAPECTPLARDTWVGGEKGRARMLVGCWGTWGEGLLGLLLAERVGKMYWSCVAGCLAPGGVSEEAGRNCGCSRGRGKVEWERLGAVQESGWGGVIS